MSGLRGHIDRCRRTITDPQSRAFRLSLFVIVLIGFVLRLHSWYSGESYHYFSINDEVAALEQAFALLAGEPQAFYLGQPAFAGGNAPGPLWTLFTAALYLLGFGSIQGALFVLLLINTFAIYLVYRIARQLFDPGWTLLTTLLFATSPWTVYYATGFYNPIALMVPGALLLLALWQVVRHPASAHIFWVAVIAAAIPHFHMIGLFYIPAILLVLWLAPVRINIRWLVYGCLAGVVLYLPYLIGDALNDWANTRAVLSGQPSEFSWSVLKIISAPATVLSNALGRAPGEDFAHYQALGNQYFLHYALLLLINLVSLLVALYLFGYGAYLYVAALKARLARRETHGNIEWLLIGTLVYVPLLLFLPTGHNYAGRYAIIIFAPLFVLPGMVIARMGRRAAARRLTATLAVMAVLNIYIVIALYDYKQAAVLSGEAFSPSFVRLAEIGQAVSGQAIPEGRYKIVYSERIRNMPEGQYKLYRAAGDYINLNAGPAAETAGVLYFFTRRPSVPAGMRILYDSPNLVIAN